MQTSHDNPYIFEAVLLLPVVKYTLNPSPISGHDGGGLAYCWWRSLTKRRGQSDASSLHHFM
jgi:hypothetical protein